MGAVVIYGDASGAAARALATRFDVVVGEAPSGDEKLGLVGVGGAWAAALAAAESLGERAGAVVLVSPQGLLEADEGQKALLRLPVPKLVIGGFDDPAMRDISRYTRGMSRGYTSLVYNAGSDVIGERPSAFADVAGDFLDRQERFRFMTESVAVLG